MLTDPVLREDSGTGDGEATRLRSWFPWGFALLVWAAVYLLSLASPPVLDDADATHAQAAQAMLRTGDWVTLHVNGIRYLEKAPLPYWMAAASLHLFGNNAFAVHLPLALTVLGLATLAAMWGRRAFDEQTGLYAALFTLTATGTFLFTRVFLPDALLSLLLALAFYAALRALEGNGAKERNWAGLVWVALAAAVLTKGLVAIVFVFATLGIYLVFAREFAQWRRLRPAEGLLLFLAIAAPWHVLAGLRNRHGGQGHGFFWFYFINEHVLRFLGRRVPSDYNKLPAPLYWSLHLLWLFPWSFFLPFAAAVGFGLRDRWLPRGNTSVRSFRSRSVLLLVVFSGFVLLFFSFSTNQEYYTLPVYLPVLLLTAAALARFEQNSTSATHGRLLLAGQAVLAVLGLFVALGLAFALWTSRHLPAAPDIGDLFTQRGVGDYTLSMSHFFDLTGASFSALRLPTALACVALAGGPALGLFLRWRGRHRAATFTVVLSSALFLVAAHLALGRFAPMLSSQRFAAEIERLERTHAIAADTRVLLFGDQALGSSIPFYLERRVDLVDGRSTSLLFGSTFPDAPPIFFTHQQLTALWGQGPRKLLFVPLEHRPEVDALLGARAIRIYESAGKELLTDRPLDRLLDRPLDRFTPGAVDRAAPGPEQ